MGENVKHPVAPVYSYINWNNGYENFPLVRFATTADGNCLFHAIANSYYKPYHSGILQGKKISRSTIVENMRKELAKELTRKTENGMTVYDTLANGNYGDFAKNVPEFSLENMIKRLQTNKAIGYGYMELISITLEKDIYILDAKTHDLYESDEKPYMVNGLRSSIVLYYVGGNYELVGIENEDGTFSTHFAPSHSFIRFLFDKITK